jgi:hypothetical protein
MYGFIVYGDSFEEALSNLGKVLLIFQEMNLSTSNEKFFKTMIGGIFLGHDISSHAIEFDPTKIVAINSFIAPQKQGGICIFLGHVGYYRSFIKEFSKISMPLFDLLTKDIAFNWTLDCR